MERLKQSVEPTEILGRHTVVVESITESPLTKRNKFTLLADSQATYAAMYKALQNARDHINLESYIIEDDETGRKFADLLLQKQAEGVRVNLIYDSVGSMKTPASFFQCLRDEVNAVILSAEFAVEMEKMLVRDLANSRQIQWKSGKKDRCCPGSGSRL